AIQVYENALRVDPESAPFHRQLAYAQYRAGDLASAIEGYKKAIQLDALDGEAKLGLSILLLASGKANEARLVAEEGLVHEPKHAGLLNVLGMAHAALGELTEAALRLEQAIEQDPHQDRPYLNLARLRLEQGQKKEAESVLERLLKIAPNHPAAT